MKNTTADLPPNLHAFASQLDAEHPEVQEAFRFLLATAMHEAVKFELLSAVEVDGSWHYTFSGAGEVFGVVRPEMDKETERRVRAEPTTTTRTLSSSMTTTWRRPTTQNGSDSGRRWE